MQKKILLLTAILCTACQGEDPAPPTSGVKRVVQIQPIETHYMENADGSVYGLGDNLYQRLVTELDNSHNFVVVVDEGLRMSSAASTLDDTVPGDRLHFDFAPLPAARFTASVEGLSFASGSKGLSKWTGYRPDFKTLFNDAAPGAKNEFPLRSLELSRSWFGTSFDPIGSPEDNTISGVDAGAEGEVNLVVAGLHYRRDLFISTALLSSQIQLLEEKQTQKLDFEAIGHGFLFAMGVDYQSISVELGVQLDKSRKIVFDQSVERMSEEIHKELAKIPFRTRVEQIGSEGIVINAGRREGISVGAVFSGPGNKKYKASEVFQIGSLVVPVDGSAAPKAGDLLVLQEGNSSSTTLAMSTQQSQEATATSKRQIFIDPPELLLPNGDAANALSMKRGLMLPYYLTRYGQYDQAVLQSAPARRNVDIGQAAAGQWNLQAINVTDAWRTTRGSGAVVAVLDTGVDYNHKDLYSAFDRHSVGRDFFSWDERPFDDNSHGTAIAGIIAGRGSENGAVGVAPEAKLLAYKAINPYGETNSAALYGAAEAAVNSGARILVLAWDTGLNTKTLEAVIRLAEEHNILLITAAGDQGKDLRNNPRYPAALSRSANLISVAALAKNGGLTQIQGRFSNYGDGLVDIAAPGEAVQSLAPRSLFLVRNGSDIAAAHVAGVAALLLAAHPEISAADAKNIIVGGATVNPSLNGLVSGGRSLNAKVIR